MAARFMKQARGVTASRYDYKVHNLLLQEERRSWVTDGFLKKKNQAAQVSPAFQAGVEERIQG